MSANASSSSAGTGTAAAADHRQERWQRHERLTIIGSGNWGSAIAKLAGENVLKAAAAASNGGLEAFEKEVRMWVFEEEIEWPPSSKKDDDDDNQGDGEKSQQQKKVGRRKLTEVINEEKENVK